MAIDCLRRLRPPATIDGRIERPPATIRPDSSFAPPHVTIGSERDVQIGYPNSTDGENLLKTELSLRPGTEQDDKGKGSPVEGVVQPGALVTLPPPREVATKRQIIPSGNLDEEEWVTVYGFSPGDNHQYLNFVQEAEQDNKKKNKKEKDPLKLGSLQIVLELVSFFSACTAFNMTLIYTIEMFPTCVRNSAIAMVFGGVFSPVMVAAGRENRFWSYGLFGLVIGLCGLFVFGLPETRGSVLCDTMDEEECKTLAKRQFIG
ncbi:hypothetical protein ISN44_As12g028320 [Arabidopsis suecica]|uniref:Uncharacterized protein n=1 Tax=Arabidopsis suecica TaxID=45249 RepID=A0A8T1YNE6_ARASU|nr:hypothetical protein ISN44_As12g028320 [Arabidopsis suecica]